jgi:hypothetical protein
VWRPRGRARYRCGSLPTRGGLQGIGHFTGSPQTRRRKRLVVDLERPPLQLTDQDRQEMIRRPAPSTLLRSLRSAACGLNGTTVPGRPPTHTPPAMGGVQRNALVNSPHFSLWSPLTTLHISRGSVRQAWPPPPCSGRSPAAAARARALSLTATTNDSNLGLPSPPAPLRSRRTKRRRGSLD